VLNDKIRKAFTDQFDAEFYSAYLYLAMAAYCQAADLPGFAHWFRIQVQEELVHATKFYDFVHARGGRMELGAVPKPPLEWPSASAAFEDALKHEEYITGRIDNLVALARAEKDFAADNFLQWFVSEQVEEEASVTEVLRKLRIAGSQGPGLYALDQEMAARVFTPPAGMASSGAEGAAPAA
jgi:ferritin